MSKSQSFSKTVEDSVKKSLTHQGAAVRFQVEASHRGWDQGDACAANIQRFQRSTFAGYVGHGRRRQLLAARQIQLQPTERNIAVSPLVDSNH